MLMWLWNIYISCLSRPFSFDLYKCILVFDEYLFCVNFIEHYVYNILCQFDMFLNWVLWFIWVIHCSTCTQYEFIYVLWASYFYTYIKVKLLLEKYYNLPLGTSMRKTKYVPEPVSHLKQTKQCFEKYRKKYFLRWWKKLMTRNIQGPLLSGP